LRIQEAVAASELFKDLSPQELDRVAAIGSFKKAKAGELLFKLGGEAASLFLIAEGRVELTIPLMVMGEQKEVRAQTLWAGRALAWSALVAPYHFTMSARTVTDVELVELPRGPLFQVFVTDPRIGFAAMSNLASVIGGRLLEAQALWVREVQRNVSETYR
jgi:CRP-like cAMP-binding protein